MGSREGRGPSAPWPGSCPGRHPHRPPSSALGVPRADPLPPPVGLPAHSSAGLAPGGFLLIHTLSSVSWNQIRVNPSPQQARGAPQGPRLHPEGSGAHALLPEAQETGVGCITGRQTQKLLLFKNQVYTEAPKSKMCKGTWRSPMADPAAPQPQSNLVASWSPDGDRASQHTARGSHSSTG